MTQSWGESGATPFERLQHIRGPVIGFFGDKDVHPSPAEVDQMDRGLARHGIAHVFHRYAEVGHGFQNPAHDSASRACGCRRRLDKDLGVLARGRAGLKECRHHVCVCNNIAVARPWRTLSESTECGLQIARAAALTRRVRVAIWCRMVAAREDLTWAEPAPTGLLVLADGTVLEGQGSALSAKRSARSASTPP